MRRLFRIVLLLGVIAAAAGHYFVRMDAYKGFDAPVIVEIPRGTSVTGIGRILEARGVVRHWALFAMARLPNPHKLPQAGDYRFADAATAHEVYLRLARGDVYTVSLTVPEGASVFDIGRLVETAGLGSAKEFVRLGLKDEGYLFPSTYQFPYKSREADVIRTMKRQFDKVWQEIGGDSRERPRIVTLASLVEKEARLPAERTRIAGVYANRLRDGMLLQCDPTVIYAAQLEGRWRGAIYKSDLERKHPYNTYRVAGLPPGPIANPGRESLLAALAPARTDDIYFVAAPDGSGAHVFSKSYEAHQKAVGAYRRGQQEAGQETKGSGSAPRNGRRAR